MLSRYNRYMLSCMIAAIGVLFFIHHSLAEPNHAEHAAHMAAAPAGAPADMYAPAMDQMMKTMHATKPTGNADIDFATQMIPHHQAAIDMAEVLLQKGKDPELQKLAHDVIDAQKKEIAFMEEWLKKNAEKK